jgi:hypothetical protein
MCNNTLVPDVLCKLELYHSRICSRMASKVIVMRINCNSEALEGTSFREQTTDYQSLIIDCAMWNCFQYWYVIMVRYSDVSSHRMFKAELYDSLCLVDSTKACFQWGIIFVLTCGTGTV